MTDVDTVELKPCPFCGSDNVQAGGDDKVVGVWCHNCEATGPNGYLTINGAFDWNTRTIAALPPAVPALITQMQDAVRNYLEPVAYERRRPGGTCLHDSRVEMPKPNHAQDAVRLINRKRDAMFIGDLIYFLDSEEHGTNTVPQCIHMTAEMAQNCPICNPSPDPSPPAVPDEDDLDERMKAAGMIPLSEMLESHGPMEKWMQHADVHTFDDFCAKDQTND